MPPRLPQIYQVIQVLEKESDKLYIPRISREDGTALSSLSFTVCSRIPGLIVDAGAGVGYSTAWLALGAIGSGRSCEIVAIEWDENLYKRLEENARLVSSAGVHVRPVRGDALDYMRNIDGIALAFIDIEKHMYPDALKLAIERVRPGGLIVFHNALFPAPPEEFYQEIGERGLKYTIVPTVAGGLVIIAP